MATYYRVIQYSPDPTADERINIGVVAYGDGHARARFLRDWRRVQAFGGEDISFLREFARKIEANVPEQLSMPGEKWSKIFDEGFLVDEADTWINCIQFTEPRGSIMKPHELLDVVTERFLHQIERRPRDFKDRTAAKKMAIRKMEAVLREKDQGLPKKILQKEDIVQGQCDLHQFDVVARNGELIFAAHALSFEVQDSRDFLQEYDSIAWHFSDVRSQDKNLSLAIVAYPPKGPSKAFEKARRLSDTLKVEILTEHDVGPWTWEKVKDHVVLH